MRVAIVGSRNFPDLELVSAFVRELEPGTTVVSGGAKGVDQVAEHAARTHLLDTIILRADWKKLGLGAGYARNHDVVANCDSMIAFWDGKSRGTKHAMKLAKRMGKSVRVVFPKAMPMDMRYKIVSELLKEIEE